MSPKTLLIAAAAVCASAAVSLPALAASDGAGAPPVHPLPFRAQILFNLVDTNGDGSIDATELAAFQKAVFNAIDIDHDGKLSPAEFQRIASTFDGGVRPALQGRPFARFMMQHGPWGRPGAGQDGGPAPTRQGMLDDSQQPAGADQQPQNFASLDTNGDGVISPDEFSAAMPGMGMLTPPAPPAPQQ